MSLAVGLLIRVLRHARCRVTETFGNEFDIEFSECRKTRVGVANAVRADVRNVRGCKKSGFDAAQSAFKRRCSPLRSENQIKIALRLARCMVFNLERRTTLEETWFRDQMLNLVIKPWQAHSSHWSLLGNTGGVRCG